MNDNKCSEEELRQEGREAPWELGAPVYIFNNV